VLARARAARYRVETLARRIRYAQWRGVECSVVRTEGDWVRLRLCRPDAETVTSSGVTCVERGIYETWAMLTDVTIRDEETPYVL